MIPLPLALSMPGMGELLVIFLIVLVLFGGARIPEIARSLGKGIAEFKRGLNAPRDGEDSKKDDDRGSASR